MVFLKEGIIVQGQASEPIRSWTVAFQTPFGSTEDLEQAIQACVKSDLDPNTCIVPVPVAHGATLYEVMR